MIHRWIHIEPIIFFYCFGGVLNIVLLQEFIYFKECVDLFNTVGNFSNDNDIVEFCKEFVNSKGDRNESDSKHAEETKIETNAAYFNTYYMLANTIPALFTTILLGAWSDQHGRKGPLLFTLLTSILSTLCSIVLATFPVRLSIYFLLFGAVIGSIGGQMLVVLMACFSSIADEYGENPEYYTFRVSVLSVFLSGGLVAGSFTCGYLIDVWSYRGVYFVAEFVFVITMLYTIFLMHETLPSPEGSSQDSQPENREHLLHRVTSVVTFRHFYEVLQTLRHKRKNRFLRVYLWIGLIGLLLLFGCDLGLMNLMLLIVKRPPFHWSDRTFGYYSGYTSTCIAVGVAVLSVIMKRCLGLRDTSLILFGLFFHVLHKVSLAFASNTQQMFAVGAIYFFASMCYPGYRSYLSKLVDSHETGKIFAVIALAETVAPMVAAVGFNTTYASTMEWYPRFVFLLAAAVIFATFLMMSFVHIHAWKHPLAPGDDQDPLVLDDDAAGADEDLDDAAGADEDA